MKSKRQEFLSPKTPPQWPFRAVIFDLDGVITQTAETHFEAWKETFDTFLKTQGKPFVPFTQKDYLLYVDGKPRYKGVKVFLESRGIDLPYGDAAKPANLTTVCGLGNNKNEAFRRVLSRAGSVAFPSSVALLREAKKQWLKVGLVTSSKNGHFLLEKEGLTDLFDAIVTGVEIREESWRGKPEPDSFLACARELGISPEDSVIIEDATSGVAAGRNGAFGQVIGVARQDNHKKLLAEGADIVVSDLSEISLSEMAARFRPVPRDFFEPKPLPEAKADQKMFLPETAPDPQKWFTHSKRKPALFFDYDGTLSPIVSRPQDAVLPPETRKLLKQLSQKYFLAIVSGRPIDEVRKFVQLDSLFYAGNHGFEIQGPKFSYTNPRLDSFHASLKKIKKALHAVADSIPGALVEDKKFSVAVHFRLVSDPALEAELKKLVVEQQTAHPEFQIMAGKKVFELLPDISWHKGEAIRSLMEAEKLDWKKHLVCYLGDDVTDEFAFRTVRGRGVGVVISEDEARESFATFRLRSVEEGQKFLQFLTQL